MLTEHRKSVRLHLEQGVVVLRYAGKPALVCAINDLSDSGCRCEIDLHSTNEETRNAWLEMLKGGLETSVTILRPPSHLNVRLMGNIAHSERIGDKLSLGIHFMATAEQAAQLHEAMIALAREKLYPGNGAPKELTVTGTMSIPTVIMPAVKEEVEQPDLSEILIRRGSMTSHQARSAHEGALATNTSISRYIMKHKAAKPAEICQALAIHSGLPIMHLEDCEVPLNLRQIFSFLTMQRHEFVPVSESKEMLSIAAAHPLSEEAHAEIEKIARREILVFLAPLDQIQDLQFRIRPRGPQQQRQHPRLKTELIVAYVFCDEHGVNLDHTVRHGTIENISDNGLLIFGIPEPGHRASEYSRHDICARVEFDCFERHIHAICRIRHVEVEKSRDPQEEDSWHFGLEIIRIDPGESAYLKDLCTRHLMDRMRHRGRGLNPDE